MARPSISLPDELLNKIDKQRYAEGAQDGEAPNRSEWIRSAIRDKLGEEVEEGAA